MSTTGRPPVLADERASRGAHRELDGRVALVTGGTRGIGAAICRTLAADGAAIAAVHQGNVGSAEDCRRTVADVVGRHGRLDIVVNSAGILSGAFFMSQAVLPHMIGRGSGRIVNIASVATSGLFGLTRSLAHEAAVLQGKAGRLEEERGIGLTVNTVAKLPVRRLGPPDEIARVVHFLCADGSAYITGQVWSVNGGTEM